ncbi:hypothetical protein BDR07DRAFT_1410264 [Suillus spraguei]|nr:hypothetical protein BDR07DRAFT_1410264 [Suillus spraguei]
MQMSVSALRNNIVAVELASKLYTTLENLGVPRFATARLQLRCIAFTLTKVRQRPCLKTKLDVSLMISRQTDYKTCWSQRKTSLFNSPLLGVLGRHSCLSVRGIGMISGSLTSQTRRRV